MERVFVETSSYDHAFELLESDDSSVYENIRHALREDLQNSECNLNMQMMPIYSDECSILRSLFKILPFGTLVFL